jgi:murein DD-endopeptidase MepM/ murein hydrolase activator NlpD
MLGWFLVVALVAVAQDDDPLGAMRDQDGQGGGGPAEAKSYTIVSGDWLSKISERFYGTPYLWPLIYEANRDRLGPDPDLIHPGVTLRIPPSDGKIEPPDPGKGGKGDPAGGRQAGGRFNQRRPLEHGTVTSNFGPRNLKGSGDYHYGLDIGVPTGTRVTSTGPGKVIFAGVKGGYGNLVEVAHPDGTVTYYAHLQRATVRVGESVAPGQLIAMSNNTGNSTGPHLHFAVERNGRFVNPRDSFSFPGVGGRF